VRVSGLCELPSTTATCGFALFEDDPAKTRENLNGLTAFFSKNRSNTLH